MEPSDHATPGPRTAVPTRYLHDRTPLEREGAIVFQNKQCRNCHSIGGVGGLRGPALDAVAARMTYDQLVRQVVQGGGNMPAYGDALDANETTALVGFLSTLRGKDLHPAIDASQKLTHTSTRQRRHHRPTHPSLRLGRIELDAEDAARRKRSR